jgi:hypothetical protein
MQELSLLLFEMGEIAVMEVTAQGGGGVVAAAMRDFGCGRVGAGESNGNNNGEAAHLVQFRALDLLGQCRRNDSFSVLLMLAGGIELVLAALQSFPCDPDMVQNGCGVLYTLLHQRSRHVRRADEAREHTEHEQHLAMERVQAAKEAEGADRDGYRAGHGADGDSTSSSNGSGLTAASPASLLISPIAFNPIHALAVVLEALRAHPQDMVVQREGRAVTARLRRDVRRVQLQKQVEQEKAHAVSPQTSFLLKLAAKIEPRPSSLATSDAGVGESPRPQTNRPPTPHTRSGSKSWPKKKADVLDGGLSGAM